MSQAGDFAAAQPAGHRPLVSWAAYIFSLFASLMLHAGLLVCVLLFFTGGGGSGGNGTGGQGGGSVLDVGFSTKLAGGSEVKSPGIDAEPLDEFPSVPSLPTFKSAPTS